MGHRSAGGTLNIFADPLLNHEALPSNNVVSADVILHPAIDVIEDLYVINQGSTLWHYRDPDQINVRWQNVLERPTDASEAEMIAGAEAETRIVSPLPGGASHRRPDDAR